jgi:hypothetical protein
MASILGGTGLPGPRRSGRQWPTPAAFRERASRSVATGPAEAGQPHRAEGSGKRRENLPFNPLASAAAKDWMPTGAERWPRSASHIYRVSLQRAARAPCPRCGPLFATAGILAVDLSPSGWDGQLSDGPVALSWAGQATRFISAPLFLFLVLRWIWRFLVWTALLYRISMCVADCAGRLQPRVG